MRREGWATNAKRGGQVKKPLCINTAPERFSHMERALLYEDFLNREHSFGYSLDDRIFGVSEFTGISEPAFVEGFMAALAFCSGAVSGGKVREMTRWAKSIDTHQMVNHAQACMSRQTLWEQNEEKEQKS